MSDKIKSVYETIASYNLRGLLILAFLMITGLGEEMTDDMLEAARSLRDGAFGPDPLTFARIWRFLGMFFGWGVIIGGVVLLMVQDFRRMLKSHMEDSDADDK